MYVSQAVGEMHFGWKLVAIGLTIGVVYVVDTERYFMPWDSGWTLVVLALLLLLFGVGKILLGYLELAALERAKGVVEEHTEEQEGYQETRLFTKPTNHTIKLSKFTISMRHWRLLHDALEKNHWKLTRRLIEPLGIIKNVTANFPEFRDALVDLDIIDKSGFVTGFGKQVFRHENPPNFLAAHSNGSVPNAPEHPPGTRSEGNHGRSSSVSL